ncbi:NAD(+) synthase [Anaerotruncus massiliensis (ex Liu et al. 2021)]|uniref:Glutamine-dependent NAD(+) synthetase n=2 Tax=Anaerotruncus TaxID=244127 RepID=A0A498CMG9_9FIRM|nr:MULTISPECIES: NAD(+) synthase [Anaerotruncus]MBC3938496.1 NAD(+) synthase [Anaerotruncus massiliensis (ex Togo et al. 2019)]RLL12107.1 NAD(+) synthase [Anaerotruncus massiliensis (ex Liu et al. 2021)]
MKDGLIKAAVGTPEIRVADCAYNAASAAAAARRAAMEGVRILALPELCLTGYTCGDLFLQDTLIEGAYAALETVRRETEDLDMLLAVGLPVMWHGKLYNCAAVLCRGEVLGLVPKTHLPNYGEYYEKRWFAPAPEENGYLTGVFGEDVIPFGAKQLFHCEELPGLVLGVEVCEDLWAPCPPSITLAQAGATVLVNLSAGDETVGKAAYRRELVKNQSARLVCGYLYANAGEGESTTDMVFSGHGLIAEDGALLAEKPPFTGGFAVTDLDIGRITAERRRLTTFPAAVREGYLSSTFSLSPCETPLTRTVPRHPFLPSPEERDGCCEQVLQIQSRGLARRLAHSGAKTAVVGISGGLDSALALLAAVRAADLLGRPRASVQAVTMPGFGTTARTKGNAELLCERLGVSFSCVDIADAVGVHFRDIGQDPGLRDVTYENAQARERTQVLMDIANRTGGLVVGTGDLSELALGWATYNGDHMSMYGVNASVPKTLVRELVAYEADRAGDPVLTKVLRDILDTPVSPELLPPAEGEIGQKTEDLVGPYELHDFFLYYLVRWGFSPRKILRLALRAFDGQYGRETILRWLRTFCRRFFAQQFKRSCLPDGPKIGSVSLSPRGDWRMPSDAAAALWLAELDALS